MDKVTFVYELSVAREHRRMRLGAWLLRR
jgi:hypothetical protein